MVDEVNLSARLMVSAAPGEVLVSGRVYQATATHYTFEPRPPLHVKGKAEPLPVFVVTGERRQRAIRLQEPTYALPMVGRQHELQIINDKLDLVLSGQAQVIGITADAGLGKSRLVAEVIRSARQKGFVGYGGACQSDGLHTPYRAWKSIWSAFFGMDPDVPLRKQIRQIEGEIEERAPSRMNALPLLSVLLDLNIPDNDFTRTLEPKFRQSALHALLEDCLKAAAQDEPLLIVIEDLHWIDAVSFDLLQELTKALAHSPICFVLAYRPLQSDGQQAQAQQLQELPNFTRIDLKELTTSEAEQAIRAKLAQLYPARSGAVPMGLVDKLMTRAQGNPFYLEELLNYLRDRGLDPRDPADLNQIELPDSLHALILSRIDQLSEHEKITLRVASIIGRVFRVAWLHGYYPELGTLPQVKTTLDHLERLDITPLEMPEPELAYLFKHIVTHEVTYESLPFATRARLHEQLARYIEDVYPDTPPLEALAFHYGRSMNVDKQREYFRKAGEAAQQTYANEAALAYYGQLLPLLQTTAEEIDVILNRGWIYEFIGQYTEAEAEYHAALDLA
jgi:adenylate cyclase